MKVGKRFPISHTHFQKSHQACRQASADVIPHPTWTEQDRSQAESRHERAFMGYSLRYQLRNCPSDYIGDHLPARASHSFPDIEHVYDSVVNDVQKSE